VTWLNDAILYEIYPQSFADANGDGVGDLAGVLEHLGHLQWLGVDTIWFNPCFASPFRDAGYDVSDYLQIAPRYGTNQEMDQVVAAARERGIRVLLDLVAGHTSVEHAWFQHSSNDGSDDRYIWSDGPGEGFVPSPGSRPGHYLRSFFDEQPALNFGYARMDPEEPWRQPVDAPGPQRNRAALREIMAFWLDRGVAGFRVDMAYSLVKDDPDFTATAALWRQIRQWLDDAYPDAVLLPESERAASPDIGVMSGFHGDYFLVNQTAHSALFNNGGAGSLPWLPDHRCCFFDADGSACPESLGTFLAIWNAHQAACGGSRPVVLASADHDFSRLASGGRTDEQLGAAFTFLLTWGTVPSIYYGDEIGMRYVPDLPDHEGSICHPGYNRAGCRTPMQWDESKPNAGFSDAVPAALYLPLDAAPDRPTVAAQKDVPDSTLNLVRRLIALRRSTPAFRPDSPIEVLTRDYPFTYLRGGTHLVVVNPRRTLASARLDAIAGRNARPLAVNGARMHDGRMEVEGFGYGVFALVP